MLSSLHLSVTLGQLLTMTGVLIFESSLLLVILLTTTAAISLYFLPDTPLAFIKRNEFQVSRKLYSLKGTYAFNVLTLILFTSDL